MKCIFCGGKADLLCDSWLGWERKRGQMATECPNLALIKSEHVPRRYRLIHTCDAPLCRACAIPAGTMYVRMKHMNFAETIDFCPGHGRGTLRREITGLEAEALRARWKVAARAQRERASPVHPQFDLFHGGA